MDIRPHTLSCSYYAGQLLFQSRRVIDAVQGCTLHFSMADSNVWSNSMSHEQTEQSHPAE